MISLHAVKLKLAQVPHFVNAKGLFSKIVDRIKNYRPTFGHLIDEVQYVSQSRVCFDNDSVIAQSLTTALE